MVNMYLTAMFDSNDLVANIWHVITNNVAMIFI